MVDEVGSVLDSTIINRTQEALGKIITKPSLTEKLLRKPPFKFIHDIMTSVIRSTGFMQGLFTEEEMNSDNIKDRESKIAFLQKAIDHVSMTNGETVKIRPGKTVAGHEPERTNEFLQALAKAIEKQASQENGEVEAAAIDVIPKKEKASSSKRNVETKVKKEVTKRDASKDRRINGGESSKATSSHTKSVEKGKKDDKKTAEDKKRSSSNNRTRERTTAKEKESVRTTTKEKESVRTKTRDNSKENKDQQRSKSRDRPTNKGRSKDKENDNEADRLKERRRSKELSVSKDARKTSTVKKRIEENGLKSPEKKSVKEKKVENDEVVTEEAIASEEVIESLHTDGVSNGEVDVEVKPVPTRSTSSSVTTGRPPTGRPPTTKQNDVDESGGRISSSRSTSPSVELIGREPEAQNGATETLKRPSTSTIRRSSARPPTARPAAPRVRVVEMTQDDTTVQQPVKQVSNIILDGDANKDNEDDETFVIEESPMITANSRITEELLVTDVVDGKPHGSLVTQILETKKDLESGSERTATGVLQRVEIVSDSTRSKEREMIAREMDKLREGVQTLSRSANPLGKLVDYLQEDVDSMLRELDRWTVESKQHEQELEQELSKGDVDLDDLSQQMSEIEEAIEEQLAKICMVKANVIRNEEKISKLVSSAKVK